MATSVTSQSSTTHPLENTALNVLIALGMSHLLNDTLQSLIPSIYPLLKDTHQLTFAQIGLITFTLQLSGSLLQPVVGMYTDSHPQPWALPIGMAISLVGLVLFSGAWSFSTLLLATVLVGTGSAIFHPEASRLARMASGGRHGFAQSIFQVGGNFGTSLGPLAAAFVVMPRGQAHLLWFAAVPMAGIFILQRVGAWYKRRLENARRKNSAVPPHLPAQPKRIVVQAMAVLVMLIFSKYIYLTCFTSYYTFFLIEKFQVSASQAQIYLFVFLFAVAAGTIIGGPVGDRFGRKLVIWVSILGTAPFALWMPYAGLTLTIVLSVLIGGILASAFSAILVYAQTLVPGKVGLIGGLFFGFAFGTAGIGSAALGKLADHIGILRVFDLCSYLPLIGLLTIFLPAIEARRRS